MRAILQILILNMNISYANDKKRKKIRIYYSNINFMLKIFFKY